MIFQPFKLKDGFAWAEVGSVEEILALAKEAGLNEKALEADLTASEAAAGRRAEVCRSAKHPLINSCRISLRKIVNVVIRMPLLPASC